MTFLSFLLIWAVVLAAHVFYYSVAARERLIGESRRIAWRTASIPFVRGSIFDSGGRLLAWTEMSYNLVFESNEKKAPFASEKMEKFVKKYFPSAEIRENKRVVLAEKLHPSDVMNYSSIFANVSSIRTETLFQRKVLDGGDIKKTVGETAYNDAGEIVGVSGLEREYDISLSGTSGKITFMRDRNNRWLGETVSIICRPVNGNDVTLPFRVAQGNERSPSNGQ